jgi:hypothetical protein
LWDGLFTYNWNINLTAGLAVIQESRLNGKYSVNQEIADNLTPDQLQKTVFRPSWFVGATFRFWSNPFEGGGKTAGQGAASLAASPAKDKAATKGSATQR